MQIGTTERQIIEAIKRSKHIKIVVDYGLLSLSWNAESSDIKKTNTRHRACGSRLLY